MYPISAIIREASRETPSPSLTYKFEERPEGEWGAATDAVSSAAVDGPSSEADCGRAAADDDAVDAEAGN